MSWLSPSTEIVPGWLSSAYAGHGILGADISATGDNGGSPVLNDGISPTAEYRWTAESLPASGSLTLFENLSFEHIGAADGSYSFDYRLYEYGVSQGVATVTLSVGSAVSAINATTANVVGSISSQSGVSCSINAVTGAAVGSLLSVVGVVCSIGATTASAVGSFVSQSAPVCAIGAVAASAVGLVVSAGYIPPNVTAEHAHTGTIKTAGGRTLRRFFYGENYQ